MAAIIVEIVKTIRPRQWIKNLACFAAVFFSGFLFDPRYFSRVGFAFITFSLISSSLYLFNDVMDAPADRKHPFKKKRPIAAGKLPIKYALMASAGLAIVSLMMAYSLSSSVLALSMVYMLLNVIYTFKLKHIPIIDVLTIATNFVIRVYVGAVVINLHMNVWFLLTVVNASLFLAAGKRQSERTLLNGLGHGLEGQRSTLSHYTTRLLDIYTGMFATTTWFAYALFAYQHNYRITSGFLPTFFSILPRTFVSEKWLMITVPVVIYGVMRYLQLVYEQNRGESPERVILSDKPLIAAVGLFLMLCLGIIYII